MAIFAKAKFSELRFAIKQHRQHRRLLKHWRKKDRLLAKALLGIR